MKKVLILCCVFVSVLFAMDVDPDQTPRGTPNPEGGWVQETQTCERFCFKIEDAHGNTYSVYADGTIYSCASGNAPSCTLKVCDAACLQ